MRFSERIRMKKIIVAAAACLLGLSPHSGSAQSIFWTELGGAKIDSSAFNGSGLETTVTGLHTPYGIAFESGSGKVYWTDVLYGQIIRSNRDGSSPTVVLTGLNLPRGIAIDESNRMMYWVENGSKSLRGTNLDVISVQNILTTGLSAPTGIAVDAVNGELYWTDNGVGTKYIGRCKLDGSSPAQIYSTTSFVSGIVVDTVHSKIFWTQYGTTNSIMSANLDGSGVSTVVTLSSAVPRGIFLAASAGRIFWTNYVTNTIESSELDGSGMGILVTGLSNPLSVVSTSGSGGTFSFSGDPGDALYFDGSTNYVNVGTSSIFNFPASFTVEGWMKVSSFNYQWEALVTKGDDSWRVARSNSLNYLSFSTNGLSNVDMTGVTNVNDGNWHYFAAVYDGSTKTLYVDGKVDVSTPVTGTLSSSTYPVYFGENAGHTGRYFNGQLDEIRIWNTARTESQVRGDMFTTLTGAQNGLLGYWQFNDGTGGRVSDTVSGNDGLIAGTPNWRTSTAPVGQYGIYDASSSADSAGPSGSMIKATLFSMPDSLNFIGVYAYGSPAAQSTATESFPAGVTKRSDLVWGVYGFGNDTVSLNMAYGGLSGVFHRNTLHLLSRLEADVSWSDLTGSFFQNTGLETFGPLRLRSAPPIHLPSIQSGEGRTTRLPSKWCLSKRKPIPMQSIYPG